MTLEFKLNLRRTAMVAIASELFNRPDVQSELKQYFVVNVLDETPSPTIRDAARKKLKQKFAEKKILDFVKTKLDPNVLPTDLYYEMLHVVNSIGCSIYRWMHYINNHHVFVDVESEKLYNFFLKEIYFTHYGTINQEKTVRNWLISAEIDTMKAFEIACLFCFEKDVHELWEKVSDNPQLKDYKLLLSSSHLNVLAYWRSLLDHKVDFMSDLLANIDLSCYDGDLLAEVNMLRLSAILGNFLGVKYFWKKLNEELRLSESIVNFHSILYFFKKGSPYYCQDQHREIIAFITRCFKDQDSITTIHFNMLKFENHDLKSSYLSMYGFVWPWPEFFKNVFESIVEILDKDDFELLIINIILESKEPGYAGLPIEKTYCLRLLSYVWLRMPTKFKTEIDLPSILFFLMLQKNELAIQLFFNDKVIAYKKQEILTDLFYLVLSHKNQSEVMKFVDTFLIPKEWEDDMKTTIRSLYYALLDKSFETSDAFPKNRKHIYTRKINLDLMYRFFIYEQNESEWGEKFLDWAFPSKKESKNFKPKFSKTVLEDHVFKCKKDIIRSKSFSKIDALRYVLFCEED